MKNIILLLLLLSTEIVIAQCLNNVSTNPLNPTNSALPNNTSLPNNDNKFLNRFNWFPVTNGFYSNYIPLDVSYAGINVGYLNNIMNDQFSPTYYNYIYDGPLPTGKNGWELLLLNLGRFPNNDPITDEYGKANGVPYIVLYNKYSGIIRVFVAFGVDGQGADAVDITLTFDNPQNGVSGNLRLNNGMDQALDQETNVVLVKSIAKDPNLSYKWMSTDFQIAYDPCVCWHPTKLSIQVSKTYITYVEGIAGGISLENQPLVNNSNIVNPQNYLAGINFNSDTKKNGVMMYKTINNMIDDYIKKYEDYNKKLVEVNEHNEHVKTNLAMLKVAKYVGVLIATGTTMSGTPLFIQNGEIPADAVMDYSFLEQSSLSLEAYQTLYMGLDNSNELNLDFFKVASKKYNSFLTSAGKIKTETVFDIASKIFGEKMETFINQNFVTKDLPVKPSMPTATFTEMKFSGQMTDTSDTYGPKFFTPGTFKNQHVNAPTSVTSPYEYPIYNESLGIFALLKTPKVLISKTVHENTPPNYFYHAWTKGYQIKLNEPLSYYFNPVLDIQSHDIKISYLIKAKKSLLSNPLNSVITNKCFIDPNFSTNLSALNCDIEKYSPIHSNTSSFMNGTNYPLVGQPTNLLPTSIDIDTLEFVSPYFDSDNFYSIIAGIGLKNEVLTNAITGPTTLNPDLLGYVLDFEIYLKVLINVKFSTLGEGNKPNTTTILLTYKIPNDENHVELVSAEIVPNLENSIGNITQNEEDLTFEDVVFNGSTVKGCKLNGNVYTCQAWNNIRVFGDLSTANGYTVNLIAGNQIETFPESVISPEISLSIVPVLNSSQPMPEATPSYVKDFCKKLNTAGQNYQADTYNKTALDSLFESQNGANNQTDLAINQNELDFQLFPNPSSQLTTVVVEGNESGLATLSIFDVMGKEQDLIIQGQNSQFNFDVSTLAKGMYFVRVNTIGASKTKQLIVK
jgi:hypothetical protein